MKLPTPKIPPWVTYEAKTGVFTIDPDVAYPEILRVLGFDKKIDQYSLEVAYQVAKMKTQDLAASLGHDLTKQAIVIHIDPQSTADKKRWALASHPRGRGPEAATKGLEAKAHYARIRHLL